MDRTDLDELERLFDEDIDMDGEKLEAFGTQVMLSDESKYAHAFAKNDDFWQARVRARLIAATINAAPELIKRVRELEVIEESLARNLADTAFCPLCLIKDCPQYGKGNLGMGAFEPELVDREQCKKSIIAHARKGAKEFIERTKQAAKEAE